MSRRARVVAAAVVLALLVGAAWWTRAPSALPTPVASAHGPAADAARPATAASRAARRADAPPPGDETTDAPDREIEFRVESEDGVPIVGARVESFGKRRTVSDDAGRVRVTVAEDDDLIVCAAGFVRTVVEIRPQRKPPDVVVMQRAAPIAGVVIDSTERPVGDVVVSGPSDGDGVRTSADGRFRFDEVDPAHDFVRLQIRADGFLPWVCDVNPGDGDVVARLSRPCVVEGRLVRPDGEPPGEGSVETDEQQTAATLEGAFRIEAVSPGERTICATGRDGGLPLRGSVSLHLADGETRRDVRVELRAGAVSYALLRLRSSAGAPVTQFGVRSNDDVGELVRTGDVVVVPLGVPAGTETALHLWGVSADDEHHAHVYVRVTTHAAPTDAPDSLTIPTLRPFEVVLVGPDGKAAPHDVYQRIGLHQVGEQSVYRDVEGPGNGRFSVGVGGAYRLRVDESGVFAPSVRVVTAEEIAAGRAVVKLSVGATVKVHVVARPPATLVHPWIVLKPSDDELRERFPYTGVAPDGRYALDHIAAGRWEARVMCCESIVTKTLTIDVPESGVLDLGDVVLDGTVKLAGRILTPDGRPAGGAEIEYFDARRLEPDDGVHASTRADGTFAVDVPLGATGDLCVRKAGLGGVIVPLDGKAAWTEVRLQPECHVRVVMRAKSDERWDPSLAFARPGGAGLWAARTDARSVRGRDVVEVRRGLAPGKWIVRLDEYDMPPIEREVTLVADETTEVVIDEPK